MFLDVELLKLVHKIAVRSSVTVLWNRFPLCTESRKDKI